MRRFVPLLVVPVLLLAMTRPALAASLTFTGYVDAEIKYTPEDKWTGRTGLEITAGMSATNKYSLKLGFFNEDRNFWESYSTWTFRPSDISLYAQGRLWTNGPIVKGTMGDFKMLGPVYMAGDDSKAAVRGAMVENLPFGALKFSGYYSWPRAVIDPLDAGATSRVWGGTVNIANFKGLKVDAYGAVRTGQFETMWGMPPHAPDGAELKFDHTNEMVSPYQGLHLFNTNYGRSTWIASLDWEMAFIDKDGYIIKYIPAKVSKSGWGPPTANTSYSYVIAAYMYESTGAYQWMKSHLQPYEGTHNPVVFQPSGGTDSHRYTEAVGAIEGAYTIAGLRLNGQFGRMMTSDQVTPKPSSVAPAAVNSFGVRPWDLPKEPAKSSKSSASFFIVSASTDVPVGAELATKPLTLTVEYRNINEGFVPWARSTVTDPSQEGYNRIEAQLGQNGFNFVASTTVLPANPVDVKVTVDSYTKGQERSQTSSLEMATRLASYEVSGKLATDGAGLGVARNINLGIPDITKLRPSYTFTIDPSSQVKHTLALSTEFNLGGFKKITAEFSYELASKVDPTTNKSFLDAATTATASYTAPNGWSLNAGWKDPDDPTKRDDTFFNLYYKVNI
ncbi:MAG: hypothetical protein IMX01_08420 [Limnochordaceae bacterium]|nr:hypothetical protein [Limnochordaceae bacterium]